MTGQEIPNIIKQKPNVFISCGCCKSIANKVPSYCCTKDLNGKVDDDKNIFINHITEYLNKISQGKQNQLMNTKYSVEKEDDFEYSKALRNVKLKCASNCCGIQSEEPTTIIENKVFEINKNIDRGISKQNIKQSEDKKCLHVNINFVNQVNLPGSVCCTCNNKDTKTNTPCNCNIDLQEENFKALFPGASKGCGAQYCVVISPEGETTIFYQEHAKKEELTKKSEKKKKISRERDIETESEESAEEEQTSQDEDVDDKSISRSDVKQEIKDSKPEDISDSLTDLEGKETDYHKPQETGDDDKVKQSETSSVERKTIEKEAENETIFEAEKEENENIEDTLPDPGRENLTGDIDEDSPVTKSFEQIEEKDQTESVLQSSSDDGNKDDEALEGTEDSGPKSETYMHKSSTEEDEQKKDLTEEIFEQKSSTDEDKLDISQEVKSIKSDERKAEGSVKSISKSSKSLKSSQSIKETISKLSKSQASEIYSLATKSIESAKKNWTKDTEYLEKEVGSYLIKSMAEIGFVQPSDPVNYLGERLYKYREMEDYRLLADDEKEELLLNKEMFEMTKQKIRTFNILKRHRHKVDVTPEKTQEGGEQLTDDSKQEEIKNDTDIEMSTENGNTEVPEDQVNQSNVD